MVKGEYVFDIALEPLLPAKRPIDQTWIFVRNWKEIEHLLKVTHPVRIFLKGKFQMPGESLKKLHIPPVVLIFEKLSHFRFSLWLRYLPFLDFALERPEFQKNFQHWVQVPAYTTWIQPHTRFPIPEGMKELIRFFQRLKFTRHQLTDHQWNILVAYGKTGEINQVAELMKRHPRTIRDQIQKIGQKIQVKDLGMFFRYPFGEMVQRIPGETVFDLTFALSDSRDNKKGSGSGG